MQRRVTAGRGDALLLRELIRRLEVDRLDAVGLREARTVIYENCSLLHATVPLQPCVREGSSDAVIRTICAGRSIRGTPTCTRTAGRIAHNSCGGAGAQQGGLLRQQ